MRSLKTRSIGLGGDSAVTLVDGESVNRPLAAGAGHGLRRAGADPHRALSVLGRARKRRPRPGGRRPRPSCRAAGPFSSGDAARKVFDQACGIILEEAERMIDQMNSQPVYTVHEMLDGRRVAPKTLLVLGRAGPLFCFAASGP